uniref:Secreted protein n=1 Tax=Helianthus annuus TaxID=4232 RepID=A0A251ULF6_HELAN
MSLSSAESRFFWMVLLLKSPPLHACQFLIRGIRPTLYSARPFHATFYSVLQNNAALSYVWPFHAGSWHVLYAALLVTLY